MKQDTVVAWRQPGSFSDDPPADARGRRRIVRNDPEIGEAISRFIEPYVIKSAVVTNGIIGCPHEEGVDC